MWDGACPPTVRPTMRDERGQTGAEYLGGLLLVALIIFAVLTTGTGTAVANGVEDCLLYTSPSPRDGLLSRMPSSA